MNGELVRSILGEEEPDAVWRRLCPEAVECDYERARPSPFTREEQAQAGAAAVYGRAYTTRCVHPLGGDTTELQLPEYPAALLQ